VDDVKATWCIPAAEAAHDVAMREARPRPCNCQCPWLVANHGTSAELLYDHEVPGIPMAEGSYEFAPWKRARVWDEDLRDGRAGYGSLCHVRSRGTQLRPDGTWSVVSHQCTGALVMQQRELLRHVQHGNSALSPQGAARVASDMLGRAIAEDDLAQLDLRELLFRAHPALLDPRIGSEAVARPLSERELREWVHPD
jgi:hypothetical protein